MSKILLAGATGYLGSYLLQELLSRDFPTRALVRNVSKIDTALVENQNLEIYQAEATQPETLKGICKEVDTVISCIGITRQKDGLTYMDVDYQANANVLAEALKSGVRKFICVSVLNGQKMKNLAICAAKEKFVDELMNSGVDYCIMRPNGFFSDIGEIYKMAENGRIYLFGDGKLRSNPIHGADLAVECVNQINDSALEVEIGGPQTLSQNEIANLAFKVAGKKKAITYIPNWVRKFLLRLGKLVMPAKAFGPFEFFMTVLAMEMIAPEYGTHQLEAYFEELKQEDI